ncbi:MAG: hypothetical protein R3C03_11130 [Pirellulaceae bacterium]
MRWTIMATVTLGIFAGNCLQSQAQDTVSKIETSRVQARISLPAFSSPANNEAPATEIQSRTNDPHVQPVSDIQVAKDDLYPVGWQEDDAAKDTSRKQTARRSLFQPIQALSIELNTPDAKTPRDRSVELFQERNDDWSTLVGSQWHLYQWDAPNIRYRKLYFEDVAAERYGQGPCGWRGTYRAAAHWASALLSAPIKMRTDPYYDCDTPYGFCRPGECVPTIWQRHVYR